MLALIVVEGFAIVLLGVLVVGLLRSHAEILRALHELGASLDPDAGRDAPQGPTDIRIEGRQGADATAYDVAGTTLDDEVAALAIVGADRPTLLAFLSSGCATCAGFWAAFDRPDLAVPGDARLVIVVKDPIEESESRLRELAPAEGTVVLSSAAWSDYGVPASPYFVYVDGPTGRVVGEGTASTWAQVADLMRQAVDDRGSRRPRDRGPAGGDAERAARTERELLSAGIGPGHPSLYATLDAGEIDVSAAPTSGSSANSAQAGSVTVDTAVAADRSER